MSKQERQYPVSTSDNDLEEFTKDWTPAQWQMLETAAVYFNPPEDLSSEEKNNLLNILTNDPFGKQFLGMFNSEVARLAQHRSDKLWEMLSDLDYLGSEGHEIVTRLLYNNHPENATESAFTSRLRKESPEILLWLSSMTAGHEE